MKNKQHKNELMKKISLIVMSCIIACGLLANHGIVKGGEMSPKVEDTVSIEKKITDSQWLSNNSDTLEVDTAGEDSVVNVVAYFCKGDTCEYWIYENEWKVNGKDTVKTLGVSTQVRLVVNDSTSKGYKMSYTFLDVKADSVGDNFRDKMMAMVAERTAKSVIGTTINFETDEYGRITKITNLSQIKKQAKALFKASMKDIAAMPIMQEMKKAIGFDFMKIGNQANTDEVVEGYLEELKLLFACHGSQYAVGEHHEHEDATKDSYANDTYINASIEKKGSSTFLLEKLKFMLLNSIFVFLFITRLSRTIFQYPYKRISTFLCENVLVIYAIVRITTAMIRRNCFLLFNKRFVSFIFCIISSHSF